MYEIQNTEITGKSIFIAGNGLFELVKNERAIMAAATAYKPNEVEASFNQIVASAVENYSVFMAELWVDPKPLEIEILVNFNQFFELVIDIKKTEAVELTTAVNIIPTTSGVSGQSNITTDGRAEAVINVPAAKKLRKTKE